jgi:hypothetical protein
MSLSLSLVGDYASSSDDDHEPPTKAARTAEPAEVDAQGRVRAYAHVEGQFATSVYLHVPMACVAAVRAELHRRLAGCPLPAAHHPCGDRAEASVDDKALNLAGWQTIGGDMLHVSLTRSFSLSFHTIEPFLRALTDAVGPSPTFDLHVMDFAFFCNEARTRSFASLMLADSAGRATLLRLIGRVDSALAKFSLPPFYADSRPHVSTAWAIGNCLPFTSGCAALVPLTTDATGIVPVRAIMVRIGQKVHELPLRELRPP